MNPTARQLRTGRYKLVGGIWHKLCSGQAHGEPEWLPATPKYYYFKGTDGRPKARCRLCDNWSKVKSPGSHHGWVDVNVARQFYIEAVNRVGIAELVRRSGLSRSHITNVIIAQNKKYVEKGKLRILMLELTSMQRKGEYLDDPRIRWQTERRNNKGLETCPGCGTAKSNVTRNCESCYGRWYDRFRDKKITKKQWEDIRRKNFPNLMNLHHGVLIK